MSDKITEVESLSELNRLISKNPDRLTVIDFYATWCGPCKVISPKFAELASDPKYANVNFAKCDVDKAQEVAVEYGITAMPTFAFVRRGSKTEYVQGANPDALKAAVEKYSAGTPAGTAAFSGKGQTLGGTPAPAVPPVGEGGIINLTPQAKVLLALIGAYVLLWYLS